MTLEQLIARQQEILNAAKSGNRGLTAEEEKEFDALQKQIDGLTSKSSAPDVGGISAPTDNGVAVKAAVEAERKRVADIVSLGREFDFDTDSFVKDANATTDDVRKAILDDMKKSGAPLSVRITKDEGDKFRDGVASALMARAGMSSKNDEPNEYRAMSLRDIGIEALSREGKNESALRRMAPSELYDELARSFYNPTAAFPSILDNAIKKSVVKLYAEVPTTFQEWTTKGSLSDFKESRDHEYLLGGAGELEEVPENGELKSDKPTSAIMPKRSLKTYGRQFSMSRQAFINDDIGFITEVPGLYAAKAKKTIDKQVYTVLYANGTTFDEKALFCTDHKNLITTGAAPSADAIQKIILLAQKQTDPFGESIYMTPETLIVPMGYEFTLATIFHSAQVVGSSNNDINPLYNYPLKIVQSPVLNALAGSNAVPWFMTVNAASARGIQVDYLNGNEIPTIRRMEAAGTLGFTWDIYLDWGINVRDFRGIYKNPGVAIS